jgi:hypothetical protein
MILEMRFAPVRDTDSDSLRSDAEKAAENHAKGIAPGDEFIASTGGHSLCACNFVRREPLFVQREL